MSLLNAVKDVVLGQAMKLAGDPRVTRVMTDPRLMNAAMKAMTLGETLKGGLDQAGRLAGGVLGFVTRSEVSNLRGTVSDLEDQVSVLQTRTAAAEAEADLRSGENSTPAAGSTKPNRAKARLKATKAAAAKAPKPRAKTAPQNSSRTASRKTAKRGKRK